jgi:hypothetical protein
MTSFILRFSMKKNTFLTPWPYRFFMAHITAVELEAWTIRLYITLAASEQPPDLIRAKGWWHSVPQVTITCTPVSNMDVVSSFFALRQQDQRYGESLHYLVIDSSRSTPTLQCVEMQWDRTDDELRIFCGSIHVEP